MKIPELTDLKKERLKFDISQKDLEKALSIPQATISRIERGVGNPSYLTVKKIFDYLEHERSRRGSSERKANNVMTQKVISIIPNSTIKEAVNLMNKHNISQLPIIVNDNNIGSITAKNIQKTIIDNPNLINAEVDIIKELPFPEIEKDWDVKDISNLLTNYSAVLVKEYGEYIGIITDADLLKFT